MRSAAVEQVVQARLILSGRVSTGLPAALRYRAEDPLAVRMAFPAAYSLDEPTGLDGGTEVVWTFARQLLAEGLEVPAGIGDVHVRPARGPHTAVELRAAEGVALLAFETAELRRFLRACFRLVPEDHEHLYLDADRALAELLG
ncbi:SsgA family sporulation/cell division regulator [Kitasatospora sp. NPDC058965]|uniref:SsgA family sporulation/cell division regulator n=1 Tax=Kitasatospora sp. NPDC058965 TaxID=3346682 RepID=UPI0036BBB60C